ncbi:hypothetical protein OAN24_06330 [Pseudodesulfovibrio sp.]|nr:hypothetical protein [Pseudodesulfovibrio sp.]
MKCREVCVKAGVENVDECVSFCKEYVTDPESDIGDLEGESIVGGWTCAFKVVYKCGEVALSVTQIKAIINCLKNGFKKSCYTKKICEGGAGCVEAICECSNSKSHCSGIYHKACK